VAVAAPSNADTFEYLINIIVRPGYDFPSPEASFAYRHRICDVVAQGRGYGELIGDFKADFNAGSDYHGSYLITQSVGELCPPQIWQLRNSAVGYRPGTP